MAEIMAAVAHLAAHPELPRPTLRICFTPDEEIGEGATLFDVERFGAACAYTIDGSELGELQDETFTAAEVDVTIQGVDVHPGFATGKLVNAARLAARIVAALPADRLTPETTAGREGFIHVYEIDGDARRTPPVRAIVRDFDDDMLAEHVDAAAAHRRGGRGARSRARGSRSTSHAQYPNMRRHLERVPRGRRRRRARRSGPRASSRCATPIRGGTDGSLLEREGLPTPNLFTGGHEYHSVREWASLQDMAAAAAAIVRLAEVWAQPELRAAALGAAPLRR